MRQTKIYNILIYIKVNLLWSARLATFLAALFTEYRGLCIARLYDLVQLAARLDTDRQTYFKTQITTLKQTLHVLTLVYYLVFRHTDKPSSI